MRPLPLGLALFALALRPLAADPTPSVQAAAEWPLFKGDAARTGRGTPLVPPFAEAWKVRLDGSLYSSPAISGGLVVLGSSAHRVCALDLGTGAARWTATLPGRVWGSSPAVDSGVVCIGATDHCLHLIALADGGLRDAVCEPDPGFMGSASVFSAPLVAGGSVLYGSDDRWVRSRPLSGGASWDVRLGGPIHDNGAACLGKTVVIAAHDGKVYALSLADGSKLWSTPEGRRYNTVPALADGKAFLGNEDGRLYALSLADGSKLWSFKTGDAVMSSPALSADGRLVFGSSDGSVYCLDAADGRERWSFPTGAYVLASPLISGRLAWVGSFTGDFYALDLDTGAPVWKTSLKGGIFTSAAQAGDRVVVAGRDGDVLCVRGALP
jgi:outer membrane protein assembly factor BamB